MVKRGLISTTFLCTLFLIPFLIHCSKTEMPVTETRPGTSLKEGQELVTNGLKVRVVKVDTKNYDYVVGDEPPEYGFAILNSRGEAFAVVPPLHDTVIQVDYLRREVRAGDRTFKIPEGETVAIAEGLAPAKKSTNP